MQVRPRARLALIQATEKALDRYPDRTVAVVRSSLERSARRLTGNRFEARVVVLRVTIRAMDAHPAVGQGVVRLWLRRARQQHQAALGRPVERGTATRLGGMTRRNQRQPEAPARD